MRTLLTTLTLFVLAAAPAAAKEVVSAEVCGADGCEVVSGAAERLREVAAPAVRTPEKAEPFVVLRIRYADDQGSAMPAMRSFYLLRSGLIASEGEVAWYEPAAPAALARAARQVEPKPASRLPAWLIPPPRDPAAAPLTTPGASPAPDGGGGVGAWWIALAALPLAFGAALARRRRGTPDRPAVYGLAGAADGRGPGRESPQG